MKQTILRTSALLLLSIAVLQSCHKKLDLTPVNDVTSETVYANEAGYKQALAKVYGAFALTGNSGPAGSGDVQGIDEGFSDFYRLFWKAQELSSDEAVIAWGDAGIQDFHNMNWSSNNSFLTGLYYRCLYQITLANDFIRQSADDRLSARGISGANADNVRQYAREARFLRAFQYWVLMDLYGNPPFVTEASVIGGPPPPQATRSQLFTYIETELKAIESAMPNARANEYGRADKAAVWALLARLYLNAGVYTGTTRYADASTYAKRVIDAGYSLTSNYRWLMLADNNRNTSEFIFTINYDGTRTQGFGGTTFLTRASIGGSMSAATYGVASGWGGVRATRSLVNLFPDQSGIADKRAQFYTPGQNLEITNQTVFTDGLAVTKYRNVRRDSILVNGSLVPAPGSSAEYADIDMPLFRLAEMHLIYVEAFTRGGGGDATTALGYINALRARAYGNASGAISAGQLNTDFVLEERARELYWEGHRRTDLIRYNRFTDGSYLWPWKGGVASGTGVQPFRRLYPLPSRDVNVNQNLTQNPGY